MARLRKRSLAGKPRSFRLVLGAAAVPMMDYSGHLFPRQKSTMDGAIVDGMGGLSCKVYSVINGAK